MSGEDDEDVDSGWEVDEERQLTRAVDSSKLLAQLLDKGATPDDGDDLAATAELPSGGSFDLARTVEAPAASGPAPTSWAETVRGGLDGPEPPPTRRASDEELRFAQRKSTTPELRLGGVREPLEAKHPARKRPDSKVHTRPTPPAPAPAQPHTKIRFPSAGAVHDIRATAKATTKVNFQAVRMDEPPSSAKGSAAVGKKGGSSPMVDLHLDAFDDAFDLAARPTKPPPAAAPVMDAGPETPRSPGATSTKVPPGRAARGRSSDATPRAQPAVRTPLQPPPPSSGGRTSDKLAKPKATGSTLKSHADDAPTVSISGSSSDVEVTVAIDALSAELSDDELAAISAEDRYSDIQDEPTAVDPAQSESIADAFEASAGKKPAARALELDDPGVSSRSDAPSASTAPPSGSSASPATPSGPGSTALAPEPSAPTPPEEEDTDLTPIRVRFERGDYLGALLRAEALLEARPEMEAAKRYVQSAQELLRQMYLGRLGSGEHVPKLALHLDEIQGLNLDHRAGFLMSIIDGVATIDEIVDISAMPALDALRLLFEMKEQGVVAIEP